MHQDIQSFSDLTVIDTSEMLVVAVQLRRHGDINFVFSINDDRFTELSFSKKYPLNTQLTFRCEIIDFVENTGAIEIDAVTVNGKQVLPIYLHLGNPQTSYFNFKDPWVFQLDLPFYPWYHGITGQGWIA